MLATIDPIALKSWPIVFIIAICIVSGLLLAVYLAQRWAPEKGVTLKTSRFYSSCLSTIAIVGAGLLCDLPVVLQSRILQEIFAIWNGGIAIYGESGAVAVLYWFFETSCHCCLDFLDIAAPGVMIAQVSVAGETLLTRAYRRLQSSLCPQEFIHSRC